MDGRKTSPWVIFKGVQCKKAWMKHILDYGWTYNAIGLEWFTKVFVPETTPLVEGRWRLMLFDGHSSYMF
jgi:DDE superfamily endonuclease